MRRRRTGRTKIGSVAQEVPAVLWILFFVLFFPILDLCAVGIRSTMLAYVAHRAATLAARAHTFETPINGYESAIDTAKRVANTCAAAFSGIRVKTITTEILRTHLVSKAQMTFSTVLPSPADTSTYMYQIQVTIVGEADPFVKCPIPAALPGVTEPLTVIFADRQYCEAPHNLTI